jgi:hypothetical protein
MSYDECETQKRYWGGGLISSLLSKLVIVQMFSKFRARGDNENEMNSSDCGMEREVQPKKKVEGNAHISETMAATR